MRQALWAIYLSALLAVPALGLEHRSVHDLPAADAGRLAPERNVSRRRATGDDLALAQFDNAPTLVHEKHIRPSKGKRPDVVEFGIYCKSIGAISLLTGTFTVDAVVTLRWKDHRVSKFVPEGFDELEISFDKAQRMIWMPDVIVSNRDFSKFEVISSTVIITRDGYVTDVTRELSTIRNRYKVSAFPFDSQSLKVRLASSSLMAEDLQFAPMLDPGLTGVQDGIFDGQDYLLDKVNTRVFEETDASLIKSRGELEIVVNRISGPYLTSILVPELFVLIISFTVFWLPLLAPFAMPRVAMALIAFLTLMTLSLRTTTMLPVRAGLTWIDMFETSCQTTLFCCVILNVFVLVVYHELEEKDLAEKLDHELSFLFPIMNVCQVAMCFWKTDGTMLNTVAFLINSGIAVTTIGYIVRCALMVVDHVKKDAPDARV